MCTNKTCNILHKSASWFHDMTFKANLKAACFRSCLTAMPKLPRLWRAGSQNYCGILQRWKQASWSHKTKQVTWALSVIGQETISCKVGGGLKFHHSKVIPLIPITLPTGVTSQNPQKIESNCWVISLGSKTRPFFNKSTSRPGVQL